MLYYESEGIAPSILDLVTNTGELSATRTGRFIPRVRAPGTNSIGGWMGSRAALDAMVKRKKSH
jgi:hypothetical protein